MWNIVRSYCEAKLQIILYPKRATIDFEIGMTEAMRSIFPDCQMHYCFFHFTQNVTK